MLDFLSRVSAYRASLPGTHLLVFTLVIWAAFSLVLLADARNQLNQWCFTGGMMFSVGALKEYLYYGLAPSLIASGIWTEVYADCASGRIYLNMWEIWEGINLVGFPKGAPNPRRVEDPLKWILWRLGRIGPYFQADPQPKKALLESARKYQGRLDDWMNEQRCKQERFYNGEDLQ